MDFHALPSRLGPAVILIGILASTGGCSTTQARPNWMRNMVFWEDRESDPRFKGPTPAEQIEQLREQIAAVPKMSADEQRTLAERLNEAFKNEADPLLRREYVRVSSACAAPAAGETLTMALADSESDVREAACEAWARHGGPQAIPKLADTMKRDAELNVRLAAVRGLAKIGGSDAITAVAPALEDEKPAMQYRAVQALREMTGKDFGDNANAWREYQRGGSPAEISDVERMKLQAF
jgi:HEAT repeat protein